MLAKSQPYLKFNTLFIFCILGFSVLSGLSCVRTQPTQHLASSNLKTQLSYKSNTPATSLKTTPIASKDTLASFDHDRLSIASFNIRMFSNKSRDDQELELIAKLIRRYDIIAIQELRDSLVLKRTIAILKTLGHDYTYQMSPVLLHSPERYAFVYRTNKVTLKNPGYLYRQNPFSFIREPYFAYFQSDHFDFILLTCHLLFGESPTDRRPEAIALADVYQYIQRIFPKEKDIILLGDFNLPPHDVGFNRLKSFNSMTYLIRPPDTTMISDSNLYDNFWFQYTHLKEYTGLSGVNHFDETIFKNNDKKAKEMVSDHRLIWSVYKINQKDDD